MKIIFTGGGTAGHIFPGLAVIEQLQKMQTDGSKIEFGWIGANKANERSIVETRGVPFYHIPTGKLRRYFSLRNAIDFFKVIGGIIKSIWLLLKLKPDMIFSKGGFVAVPPCVAAKFLRIPVVIHESDFSPGLTTKITSKFAAKIFVSYRDTITMFSANLQSRCIYAGNSVREIFYTASAEEGKRILNFKVDAENANKKILLVIGGSLGAKQINDLVQKNIVALCENFFVVHQLGAVNFSQHAEIETALEQKAPKLYACYKAFDFIGAEMPYILAAADIVVSRAGANSLWEIISRNKPCVLIPLSTGSSRGDQAENAAFFEKANCAAVLDGENASAENFLKTVLEISNNETKRQEMIAATKNILPEPAAQKIAEAIFNLCKGANNV